MALLRKALKHRKTSLLFVFVGYPKAFALRRVTNCNHKRKTRLSCAALSTTTGEEETLFRPAYQAFCILCFTTVFTRFGQKLYVSWTASMTEQLLRRLWVYANLKQCGCIAMPDLMQNHRRWRHSTPVSLRKSPSPSEPSGSANRYPLRQFFGEAHQGGQRQETSTHRRLSLAPWCFAPWS